MSDTELTPRTAKFMRKIAKYTSAIADANLKIMDQNGDGALSVNEAIAMLKPVKISASSQTPMAEPDTFENQEQILPNRGTKPTSVITDDAVIFNRDILRNTLSVNYRFGPDYVDDLITKALPKGVSEVRLSDMCLSHPELECLPLPNGKVLRFNIPSIGT